MIRRPIAQVWDFFTHTSMVSSAVGDATHFEQELYGVNELDANLWKAYFRANAEYITR